MLDLKLPVRPKFGALIYALFRQKTSLIKRSESLAVSHILQECEVLELEISEN